ncbi:MAG: radical SAM protein [Bacteroidales bacterium]|nr:radical SAM protein [Bacteroidales bacterium]
MNKKHINIPVFIPELACPFQCIYCNQRKISGQLEVPGKNAIITTIETYLQSITDKSTEVQLAYFGGNFTGIPISEQEEYLQIVQPYIKSGQISGIRISTRPDYIDEKILSLLKKYHVESIELGAQSLDDEVLRLSKRGHLSTDTEQAANLVKNYNISLGLQMMIGLPGDTFEKSAYTARKIIELGADNTRIYPTLVIRGTQLEEIYNRGDFSPLSLVKAVEWSVELYKIFEQGGVKILKLGLHPSEGLLSGKDLIAGPFHPSFRELVLTALWKEILLPLNNKEGKTLNIWVAPGQVNHAVGYSGSNKKMLLQHFKKVNLKTKEQITGREFIFEIIR